MDLDINDETTTAHGRLLSDDNGTPARNPRGGGGSPGVYLLACSAAVSGFLFGFDTGVISSMLVSVHRDLSSRELTTFDKSLITAITSLLALASAPFTGYLADRYGRLVVIGIADALFIVGALIQAFAGSVALMIAGRASVGAAIGLASTASPLYIAEIAPAKIRGRLVTIQSLCITGGQVTAYLAGWVLTRLPNGWRWLVGLGAGPAAIQLFLLAFMAESPRWLVQTNQIHRARLVLETTYSDRNSGSESLVSCLLARICNELSEQKRISPTVSVWGRVTSTPHSRRALIIACGLQALQQLCGFNSLMYFSATIFQLVGFRSPIATSVIVAATNFLFTVLAFSYIDRIGRRKILLLSMPVMVFGLLISACAFAMLDLHDAGKSAVHAPETKPAWSMTLLGSLVLYVAAYAVGLGCVPWQQSELFPFQSRSLGSGFATATNWASNFLVGLSFLPMLELVGASTTFVTYAVFCGTGWCVIWAIYPETAGLELERVGELLTVGWQVQESVDRFHNRNK